MRLILTGNASNRRGGILVAESLGGASFGLRGFFFAVLRRSSGFERTKQPGRDPGHFLDRGKECGLVRLRRLGEAADLSYKLQRRRPNLIVCDWRIEIEKRFDISAHFGSLLF
jgi:hypothetical protein